MSTLKLQERFSLEAPPDVVFAYLTDPRRTVGCLPGAEITGQEDDRTYAGAVKVKVGAVTVSYGGRVVFEQIDDVARSVRIVGKGREKGGSGAAEMTMEGRVLAAAAGGSEVTLDSEVRLTGKIVRFGRGMIETVSAEILKEFRSRLAEELRREVEAGAPGPEAAPAPAEEGPDGDTLRIVPLLWGAFLSWLRRLFGRA